MGTLGAYTVKYFRRFHLKTGKRVDFLQSQFLFCIKDPMVKNKVHRG